MPKYPLLVNLLIAMVAIVIIGSSLDVLDATFGTRMSATSGIWLALTAAILLASYIVIVIKERKNNSRK
jgi:hypothetical protein